MMIFLVSDGLDRACHWYLWAERPRTPSNHREGGRNERDGDETVIAM